MALSWFALLYLRLLALSGDVARSSGLERGIIDAKVIPSILDLDNARKLGVSDEVPRFRGRTEPLDHTHAVFVEVGSDGD